jgi:pyrimidine deaminase RibD-like protein/RNA-binding protein YhbY
MMLLCPDVIRIKGFRIFSSAFVSFQRYGGETKRTIRSLRVNSRLCHSLNDSDDRFLMQAVQLAKKGYGHTFPNPTVGCVIVNERTGNVVGSGFHPRAGFPHAEVFALLEASGHIESGVSAAESVVKSDGMPDPSMMELFEKYSSKNGPEELFLNYFADTPVTAYVTLEPCCHYGRTPPCAATLALANVNRVVVGYRDPNPRVDGGGLLTLKNAGVEVESSSGTASHEACKSLVNNFCKRITPRPEIGDNYDYITGKMRRFIRSLSSRMLQEKELVSIDWGGQSVAADEFMEENIMTMTLKPEWMEHVDSILWKHELLMLKLNKAIQKRKGTKLLGERIASALNAHVAQTKGHTILLYRPGIPPVLRLDTTSDEE